MLLTSAISTIPLVLVVRESSIHNNKYARRQARYDLFPSFAVRAFHHVKFVEGSLYKNTPSQR